MFEASLNPYFIGLSILIMVTENMERTIKLMGLNPYFIGLSILMRCILCISHSVS